MRPLIVVAVTLAIAGCGKNQSANPENAGAAATAENIVANDVTAIDAVTGDAANMAADVEINAELNNTLENAAGPAAKPPRTRAPGKPPLETPAPAETPTNNSI